MIIVNHIPLTIGERMSKTIIFLLSIIVLSQFAFGAGKKKCDAFYSEVVHIDHYRKLELNTKARKKWLKKKRVEFKEYHHDQQAKEIRDFWEDFYYKDYDKKRVLQSFQIEKSKIQLIDRGLRKPDEVVFTEPGGKETVIFQHLI